MAFAFEGCINLTLTASDGPDLSNVTDMSRMFEFDSALNGPIVNWDTSHVTDMLQMFSGASAFNQPIGSWNTSNVTGMAYMFRNASTFNQPIGSWKVGSLTDAHMMFYGVKLSTENYDALLHGWDAQALQSGVVFDGGNSTWCTAGAARAHLINVDDWTITDGGLSCMMNIYLPFIRKQ